MGLLAGEGGVQGCIGGLVGSEGTQGLEGV